MPWWAWGLIAWAALSVPVAVLIGRAIARADHERDDTGMRRLLRRREAEPTLPEPGKADDPEDPRTEAG